MLNIKITMINNVNINTESNIYYITPSNRVFDLQTEKHRLIFLLRYIGTRKDNYILYNIGTFVNSNNRKLTTIVTKTTRGFKQLQISRGLHNIIGIKLLTFFT